MAEIEEPSAVAAVGWRSQNLPGTTAGGVGFGSNLPGGRDRRHGGRNPYAERGAGHGDVADAVSLFGIETQNLGPELRDMLVRVAGEIEGLRHEIDRAQQREQYLEQQIHQHPVLPVMNIRAFRHHLDALLRSLDVADVPAVLALFYLDNHEDLRRRFGLAAADACLDLLARQVLAGVRATDIVGAVGPAGILVLFHPALLDGVRAKTQRVVDAVAVQTLRWRSADLPLQVVAGVRGLHKGDAGDEVLEELDQQIRRPSLPSE